jgi:hypothetical protein
MRAQRDVALEAMMWLEPGNQLTVAQGRAQAIDAMIEAITGMSLAEKLAAAKSKLEGKQ